MKLEEINWENYRFEDIVEYMKFYLKNGYTIDQIYQLIENINYGNANPVDIKLMLKLIIKNKNIFFNIDEMKYDIYDDFINTVKNNLVSNEIKQNKFIVMSDTHIGRILNGYNSISRDLECAKIIYQFGENQKIENIFHCGDILDGNNSEAPKNRVDLDYQSYMFKEYYPNSDRISTYFIDGNHDPFLLNELLKQRVNDIHLGSYNGFIKVGNGNDIIELRHPNSTTGYAPDILSVDDMCVENNYIKTTVILNGHSHYFAINEHVGRNNIKEYLDKNQDKNIITVPSASSTINGGLYSYFLVIEITDNSLIISKYRINTNNFNVDLIHHEIISKEDYLVKSLKRHI